MNISVADEVWIAAALLHREHPEREDFDKQEILARARREHLVTPERPGLSIHISTHAVANKKPQPNTYRMLVETRRGRRRLFRDGDVAHSGRNGKLTPKAEEIPSKYRSLLNWYDSWRHCNPATREEQDPLLALAGKGKGIWGKDAVTYVNELRGDA